MAKDGKKIKPTTAPPATAFDADGRISIPVPAEWLEAAAAMNAARARIDRYHAVRDGQIPPPMKRDTTKRDTTKRKEGPQERLLTPVFRECWPPDGQILATVTNRAIIKKAGDAYEKRYDRSVDRKTILRKAGRLSR
jgi:hypothetical protein